MVVHHRSGPRDGAQRPAGSSRSEGNRRLTACGGLRRGSCGGAATRLLALGLVASGAWRASSMSGEGSGRAPQIYVGVAVAC
jgi:hypothetical protein